MERPRHFKVALLLVAVAAVAAAVIVVRQSGGPSEGPSGATPAANPEQEAASAHTAAEKPPELRVDLSRFRQLLRRDAIEPVYAPQFVSAHAAGLEPEELVMGVELNGESKAYPIGPLNLREMVNDVVGGVPVLITW